jgi:hypothetical protein
MTEGLLCANHPHRHTTLRCNRCEKPICPECAIQTPVGYRCKECVRGQQKVFDTSTRLDYPIAGFIAFVAVGLAAALLDVLGFWGLFLSPVVGGGIAEIISRAIKRRRSRRLPLVATIAGGFGALTYLLYTALPVLSYAVFGGPGSLAYVGGSLLYLLWPVAYGALMCSTIYYRLKGIRL